MKYIRRRHSHAGRLNEEAWYVCMGMRTELRHGLLRTRRASMLRDLAVGVHRLFSRPGKVFLSCRPMFGHIIW